MPKSMYAETRRKAGLPLRKVDEVFADLPPAELHELASALRSTEIEAGTDIVRIDDFGAALYLIQTGEGGVIHQPDEATEALGPGATFGEIALLLTGQWTATVVARTPMRLLSLSGQDFEGIRARVQALERSLRRRGLESKSRDIVVSSTTRCPREDSNLRHTV